MGQDPQWESPWCWEPNKKKGTSCFPNYSVGLPNDVLILSGNSKWIFLIRLLQLNKLNDKKRDLRNKGSKPPNPHRN